MPPQFSTAAEYIPRRPHDTVLYGIVRVHLATFLGHTERTYAAPLPKYVVDTFEHYLTCGDPSQGFLRCHCDPCGLDGRWSHSLADRIFGEEVERMAVRLAGVAGARTGSIGFGQLFGGSLNLNPHLHTLAAFGVFEKVDGGVRFHEAPPPSKADVAEVARRVRDRAVRWLRRHGHIDERAAEERGNETVEPSAIEACAQLALAGGAFLARPYEPKVEPNADLDHKEPRFSARLDGFDVHCAVRIAADDDVRRERLVRYCARPAVDLAARSDRGAA